MPSEERSRIDGKKKRDELMTGHIGDLWDDLCLQIEQACNKLNAYFKTELEFKKNGVHSVVRVFLPSIGMRNNFEVRPQMEVCFLRHDRRVEIKKTDRPGEPAPTIYRVKADADNGELLFEQDGTFHTPLALAEHLVAEYFAGINLDE
jgi:hypothetical protein